MSQNIIKFNIGGTRYEVSQSLLQSYPDTMLAKNAEEQWHKDPNEEIFIDRNGFRFQFVLDYLRDGKVSLPPTITKASLISDLQYFGVDNIQEDTMDESSLTTALYMKSKLDCIQAVQKWDKEVKILEECIALYNLIDKCNSDQISVKGTSASFIFPQGTPLYFYSNTNTDAWNEHFKEFGFCIGKGGFHREKYGKYSLDIIWER
jgi:hypothetical protein